MIICYCPHHADGDEDCDRCVGCKASLNAVEKERERCAKVAEDEKVDAEDTQHAADIAYNDACMDIARRIREGA